MPFDSSPSDRSRLSGLEIHLVNPLWDAHGGADLRTVDLCNFLGREHRVRLWSEYRVHDAFRHLGVERIRPWHFPRAGTVVVVGVYFRCGAWLRWTSAERILIYNTAQPDRLSKWMRRLGDQSFRMVYTSQALREATFTERGLMNRDRGALRSGTVLESLVEPTRFARVFAARQVRRPDDGFVVGRLSRDNPRKHHPDEPRFLGSLAREGMRVRVMGGTSLAARGDGGSHVELLPAGTMPSETFLASLDAFYYRTHPDYFEAFGRVVLEAMLSGLPVVAEARGGYARHIRHGHDGFLFEHPDDAHRHLRALRDDPALRLRIGREAHRTAIELFAHDLPARTCAALAGTSFASMTRPVAIADRQTACA